MLLMLAAVVVVTVVVCLAIFSLADAPVPVARAVTVLGGAALLVGFLVGPILVGAVDQLDPRRFAVFGVDERQMPWVLTLAAFVSVPSLALLAVYISVCVVAVRAGTPWPLAILMTFLGVVTTVLVSRIGMAVNALLLPERRSRELTALFALALLVIAFPVAVFLGSLRWDGLVPDSLATLSTVLGFSPFAAAPAFLFAAAAGETASAWASGTVAVLTVGLLWVAWSWLVRRLLTTTERPVTSRERTGLGWFGLLPSNAFGAIASRSLVYWLRDRRYIMNIIVVPIAGVLTVLPLGGLAASLLFSALGISSIVSVVAPYAVSRPGDSPFQQPQRPSSRGTYGPAAAFLGAIVVSIPTAWLFAATVLEGSAYAPATFWVGLLVGLTVLAAGAVIGGRIFERSGERLMEFVETA
jgi:ABC-2 type transport system permease protein